MKRQDEAHDHRNRGNSVDAHYDLLRSAGYGREKARDWAERATDTLHASQGDGASSPGVRFAEGASNPPPAATCRSRFRTPHFGPHAGRRCRVLDDGTLEPVEP